MSTTRAAPVASVSGAYAHRRKRALPGPLLELPDGGRLKWIEIAPEEAPVPAQVSEAARAFLSREAASGSFQAAGEPGFAILHRCGGDFYFLLACTWRNDNELWETVYAKPAGNAGFAPFAMTGAHRPTFCVWELAAIGREQQAWDRYLLSRRDPAAAQAWAQDTWAGTV